MKVLCFAPFADVWQHSFPEALVAETCQQQGWETTVIRCRGVLSNNCIAMSAALLAASASASEREKICRSCRKHAELLDDEFQFDSRYIDDYLDTSDHQLIERLVRSVSPDDWFSFQIDDTPIGRLAAYEFYLHNKLNSYDIPEQLWDEYLGQLRNSVAAFLAAKKFLPELMPDRLVITNTLYSVNNVVTDVARQLGIQTFTIHAGLNIERMLETLCVSTRSQSLFGASRSEAWTSAQALPVSKGSVEEVSAYIRFLMLGTGAFVYSSAHGVSTTETLREQFGVTPGQKVLLCTTSSEDEILAAQLAGGAPPRTTHNSLFETQLDWLRYVIEMGRRHPEWCIVVRVHPREFPNRRERQLSQNAIRLQGLLTDLPENVVVNWPDQGISLYDLAKITDVLLNHFSSAGIEFLLLGTPVVAHNPDDIFMYPRDFNYSASSLAEYELVISQAISDGWSFEHMRKAFRWKTFQFRRLSVDLGSAISPWSVKSPLRVLRGLRYKWKWPVPLSLILFVERHRARSRPPRLPNGEVITDVIRYNRENLSNSNLWHDDTYATDVEENEALVAALSELHTMVSSRGTDPGDLGLRMGVYLESRSALPAPL